MIRHPVISPSFVATVEFARTAGVGMWGSVCGTAGERVESRCSGYRIVIGGKAAHDHVQHDQEAQWPCSKRRCRPAATVDLPDAELSRMTTSVVNPVELHPMQGLGASCIANLPGARDRVAVS